MFDCVVRGGTVVSKNGVMPADVAIQDGIFAAIGLDLPGAKQEIDARGLHLLPGVIDVHVHFNDPGRADWEGALTGSSAFAAGGGTLFFDMPLNSTPCVTNGLEFDRKREALERNSICDFGLWGGLVPGSVSQMAEMAARGVIGFKAFMSDSGLPEFPRSDDRTLYQGMIEAARLGLPVAVHAENEELTAGLARDAMADGKFGIRDYLRSRPVIAEVEAIQRACLFAGAAGAMLHIVHISSGQGGAVALEARSRGVDVTIETCPHYLLFTEEDMVRLGAVAKCAPPLRDGPEREGLWRRVFDGSVDIVASDHSPAPASMKRDPNFFRVWGGIAGVQSTLAVLLTHGFHRRGVALTRIASLLAGNAAKRFRVLGKGQIAMGQDADLAIVDLNAAWTLTEAALFQKHRSSPYIGEHFRGTVTHTIRRGETVFAHGAVTAKTNGKLIRPNAR